MPRKKEKDVLKKKTLLEKVKSNIELASNYQDTDGWKKDSLRFLDYFKGKYYAEVSRLEKYTVNTVFNFVNLIVPNLFFQDPYLRVKPRSKYIVRRKDSGDMEMIPTWRSAKLMESVINKTIRDIGFSQEVRKCVQDCLFYGFAVLKVGYGMETEAPVDIEDPENAEDSETPRIKEEGVFVSRICPLDFFFDPISTGVHDARFLVHRIVKPKEEIEKNDIYENTEDLKGEFPEEYRNRFKDAKEDVEGDFVTLHEYHDLIENKIYTLTKNSEKFLRKIDNPHQFTGSHFVVLKFAGDNDSFRGIPMIATIEDQAVALNETYTKMIRHLDIFPGQVIAEEGSMDEDEMQMWQDGEQGSILPVKAGALREGKVTKSPPMQMGADYFNVARTSQQFMDLTLGIQDFQRPTQGRRKTATEVTFEQADSTIRREYFLGFVKEFVLNAVTKVAALVQQYYDRERVVRIEGDAGVDFVPYTKDDITGEYDYDFDIQSMRFRSQSQFQQIVNWLNILGAHAANIPEFKKLLDSLDGNKLGKYMAEMLDLNIEQIKKHPEVAHLEFNPETENEYAKKGKSIPDPKPMQDHDSHLAIHALLSELPEMQRHIRMHTFYKGVMNGEINVQQLMQQQGGQGMGGGAPQMSAGFQPGAGPARTEPELAGGFFGNGQVPQ